MQIGQFAQLGRWAAIAVALGLGGTMLYGTKLPSQVEITRSIVVNSPPGAIYPLLSDFRNGWTKWYAIDDEDPGIAYAYAGPGSGEGAVQTWTSKKLGDGRMVMTRADSLNGVGFEMTMGPGGKDFHLTGTLAMTPESEGTRVTWIDIADLGSSPTKRLMGPIFAKMRGQSFEKSLAGIKRLAEAAPAPTASIPVDSADSASGPAALK